MKLIKAVGLPLLLMSGSLLVLEMLSVRASWVYFLSGIPFGMWTTVRVTAACRES